MRLSATVTAEHAELAAAALIALVGGGCRITELGLGCVVEVWAAPADVPTPSELSATLGAWGIDATLDRALEDPAWRTATKSFHRPVEIGGLIRVRPPWEPAEGPLADVVVDPGMAFGSGQHGTTRGCLEALCEAPRTDLLDVGCGSGILAIGAARLGYSPVRAVDADRIAVEATRENAARNGVSLAVHRAVAGADSLAGAATLVANLTATALLELADAPPSPLPEIAVLSGLREFELDAVQGAWLARGLALDEVRQIDGWCTLVLAR